MMLAQIFKKLQEFTQNENGRHWHIETASAVAIEMSKSYSLLAYVLNFTPWGTNGILVLHQHSNFFLNLFKKSASPLICLILLQHSLLTWVSSHYHQLKHNLNFICRRLAWHLVALSEDHLMVVQWQRHHTLKVAGWMSFVTSVDSST